ncbi:hypothetical protein DFH07DRAFT_962317 [Mycena maculata]|uniref:Uncharacterized protein n=1 Tax=Mycena maculata TaxID=230809 RepID=A0AAD7IRP3_9AGAR|nr:hypothetical protein DFH07DRAFT_962317 [Mycena maculata]
MQTFPTVAPANEAPPSIPAATMTLEQQRNANATVLSAAMASLAPGSQGAPVAAATTPTELAPTVDAAAIDVAMAGANAQPLSPAPSHCTLYLVVPTAPLMIVHEDPVADGADGPLWYCITKGTYVGVHTSHALALTAVQGVGSSAMKSYKTQALAVAAFNEMLAYRMVAIR